MQCRIDRKIFALISISVTELRKKIKVHSFICHNIYMIHPNSLINFSFFFHLHLLKLVLKCRLNVVVLCMCAHICMYNKHSYVYNIHVPFTHVYVGTYTVICNFFSLFQYSRFYVSTSKRSRGCIRCILVEHASCK